MRWRTLAALATLLWALCAPVPAHALSEQAELEKARTAFVSKNYADVETRMRNLLGSTQLLRDPLNIAQARMLLGAALVEQQKLEEGQQIFEQLLLEQPHYDPDPLTFPSRSLDAFIDTRSQLSERLAAKAAEEARRADEQRRRELEEQARQAERLLKLEQMASEEKITMRSSRLVASLPFGAGQFQNGHHALGALFLGAELALLAGSVLTVPLYRSAQASANAEYASGDLRGYYRGYRERAHDAYVANLALNGALVFTVIAGITQAHIAYVPEKVRIHKRPIPPRISLQPSVAPTRGGASFGLSGQF